MSIDLTFTQLSTVFILFAFIWIVTKLLSRLEKIYRQRSKPVQKEYLQWSLPLFKIMTFVICLAIAAESTFLGSFNSSLFFMGLCLLVFGMLLRILAINTLGPMWTYKVVRLHEHTKVRRGIYKHLRHPAYIGNVYLVGLALIFSAPLSALLAMFFVLAFILVRASKEQEIIADLAEG